MNSGVWKHLLGLFDLWCETASKAPLRIDGLATRSEGSYWTTLNLHFTYSDFFGRSDYAQQITLLDRQEKIVHMSCHSS